MLWRTRMSSPLPHLAFALLVTSTMFGCVAATAEEADAEQDESTEQALDEAPVPPGCDKHARVFSYNPRGWETLTQAFADNPSACADYYVHIPAPVADKTKPRGPNAAAGIRAHGQRFHALAEFHFGAWSEVTNMTWYEKGVEFRKRMVEAGYDPKVDSWAINELPSSVRKDPTVRAHVRDLVRGLYEGPAGAPKNGGLVFTIGVGSQMVNYSAYKPALEDWTLDRGFWEQMDRHVRWWGQEVYARPAEVCVGSASPGQRAAHINAFTMHPAKLAASGPEGASAARAFFDESYTPVMNAFWGSDVYGTTNTSLADMKHLVSTEIYAARVWANDHDYPDWRIGLAWNEQLEGATAADRQALATRIANAIKHGYSDQTDEASRACSPSGAYTWCVCDVAGAAFNDGFKTFGTW